MYVRVCYHEWANRETCVFVTGVDLVVALLKLFLERRNRSHFALRSSRELIIKASTHIRKLILSTCTPYTHSQSAAPTSEPMSNTRNSNCQSLTHDLSRISIAINLTSMSSILLRYSVFFFSSSRRCRLAMARHQRLVPQTNSASTRTCFVFMRVYFRKWISVAVVTVMPS